eukprot:1483512-Pleurochrysis_carterae.AAC.2
MAALCSQRRRRCAGGDDGAVKTATMASLCSQPRRRCEDSGDGSAVHSKRGGLTMAVSRCESS